MNALPLVLGAAAVFALAYRFYYSFIVAKVLTVSDTRQTPANGLYDGQNYVPMSKAVVFGQHFAAIAGAGPLVGPVLAVQFGYFPGFLWIVLGAVFAGAAHDLVILAASVRHDGKSLAEIAKQEISKVSGFTASIVTVIIIILTIAGLGLVVVSALAESPWVTFTIASTIPIAVAMGLWMFRIRPGKTTGATIFGVIALAGMVIGGKFIPGSCLAPYFTFNHKTSTLLLAGYGFFAAALPVWLLLSPRGYLSSIMKLAVLGALGVGVIFVAPELKMPAITGFAHGGGPIIPGTLYPYLFITIACGAISGFHSLVCSGTTAKMIMAESHMKAVAAGAMLVEGFVAVLALIAASSLFPLDYFQINVPADKFAKILPQLQAMGFTQSNLASLSATVNENIVGRTGGAVSLAVGMAQIFSAIPGLRHLMSYWYHFAIMFEALFILTTIDAGTRIARFILQEALGKIYQPFARTTWIPGNLIASFLVVFAWGYFLYTGTIATIWPMFGAANQLLATLALAVGTSFLINHGKAKYAAITVVPMIFVGVTTLIAAFENITNIYVPQMLEAATRIQGIINASLTGVIIVCLLIVLGDAVPRWFKKQRSPGTASAGSVLDKSSTPA
jgi:carbon starvation protein